MEYLASHGFVVISIQHLDQFIEFRALQGSLSKDVKDEQSRIMREIRSSSRDRRAELWGKYFRIASNTNRIVSARSVDVAFVISEMPAVLSRIPELDESAATRIVGVLGLSLGGAVATEFSETQGNHLRCVVNMDGGYYGQLQDEPVRIRYLMLYTAENEGINDGALNAVDGVHIRTSTLAETKHLNFHDIAGIYPIMKWMRAIGSADPRDVLRRRNEIVHEFAKCH